MGAIGAREIRVTERAGYLVFKPSPPRQSLSRKQCFDRLRTARIGHVALTSGALPYIAVVRYYVVGEIVFFDAGSAVVSEAIIGHVVAFESGNAESAGKSDESWSVCAVGVVVPAAESTDGQHIMELRPELMSGWYEPPRG